MKKLVLALTATLTTLFAAKGDTITLWDFNFPTTATTGDANGNTGTFIPYVGSGSFTNIGTTTNSFGNQSTSTSDPWITDNSALRLGKFPSTSASSKTSGIQFFTSTLGYENIQVSFDQENSATASKYWRFQYTTNGTTWDDYVVLQSAGSTAWLQQRTVDLSAMPGVRNNPNFGVRYVSEFESTATGAGIASYVGNSGTYGTAGTLWVDMVTVSGVAYNPANGDPTISQIANQTNRVNQTVGPLSFTVSDPETAASQITLSAMSLNQTLFKDQNITFGGSDGSRTITLIPETDQLGTATIIVFVDDTTGKKTSMRFNVTILPLNTTPTLTAIGNQVLIANTFTNIPFTVSDLETSPDNLIYTIETTAPEVISPSVGQILGTGSDRILKLTATTNDLGSTKMRLIVSDGTLAVTNLFTLKMLQPAPIVLWNFNSLVPDTNAATGTFEPASGFGTFTNIGSPTFTFGNIANTDTATDECSIRLTSFPLQGTSNKTSGVEFRFSTAGFKNIAMAWDQQNSSTASRYWRIQYTLDGVNFADHIVYTNLTSGSTIQTGADFLGFPGVDNNPNFGVRIVSEWESSIDVSSTNGFMGVAGGYGVGGTCWFDMITVTGESSPQPPSLSAVANGNNIVISWPSSFSGYSLQGTISLGSPTWQTVAEPIVSGDGQNVVTIPIAGSARFFRLSQ